MADMTRKPAKPQHVSLKHPMDEYGRCIDDEIPLIVIIGEGLIEFTPKYPMKDIMDVREIASSMENIRRYHIDYHKPDTSVVLYTKHPKGWVSSVSRNLMIHTFTVGLNGLVPHLTARELMSGIASVFPRQMLYMLTNEQNLNGRNPWVTRQIQKTHRWAMDEIDKHVDVADYRVKLEFQKELLIAMEDKVRVIANDAAKHQNASRMQIHPTFKDLPIKKKTVGKSKV